MPLLTTQSARSYGFSLSSSFAPISAYYQIATILSPSGSGYTFSNIPQTYDHLELRIFGKDGRNPLYSSCNVQINGDTAGNYNMVAPQVDSRVGAPYGGESFSAGFGAFVYWPGASSSTYWGSGSIKIFEYTNTNKNKTMIFNGGYVGYGDGTSEQGMVTSGMGNWRSTAAVTSLVLTTNGGSSFAAGTRLSLYGIKGA